MQCCRNKKFILEIEKFSKVLKDIAEPNRLKILCLLKERPQCVCDIWQCLGLPQNLVSHHLKILKNLGLVSSKKRGLNKIYKLNKEVVRKYIKSLNKLL